MAGLWEKYASRLTDMTDRRSFMLMVLTALAGASCRDALAKDGDGKSRNRRGRDRDDDDDDLEDDRERIHKAVSEGRARPLRDILRLVRSRYRGELVRVRLKERNGTLVYRIRLIDAKNALIDVEIEAASGRIVKAPGL